MKRIALVLSMALALCSGTLNVQAGGHGCHGGGCHSCWGFGIGVGVGFSFGGCCSYPACGYAYAPAYTYVGPSCVPQPAMASTAASSSAAVAQVVQPSYLAAQPLATPGHGTWVPDPKPYSYIPGRPEPTTATDKSAAVTVARVATGPTVYVVTP